MCLVKECHLRHVCGNTDHHALLLMQQHISCAVASRIAAEWCLEVRSCSCFCAGLLSMSAANQQTNLITGPGLMKESSDVLATAHNLYMSSRKCAAQQATSARHVWLDQCYSLGHNMM